MPRGRVTTPTDYRAVLKRTGDVTIGAHRAVKRRRALKVGAAGLLLIGASAWLLVQLWPRESSRSQGRHPVLLRCVECGHQEVVALKPGPVAFPLLCSSCGKRACQAVWECRDCGHRFIPKGRSGEVACEQCGSRRVGMAENLGNETDRP